MSKYQGLRDRLAHFDFIAFSECFVYAESKNVGFHFFGHHHGGHLGFKNGGHFS